MWSILYVLSTSKPKLNCWDLSNQVQFIKKTKIDNDITDRTNVVYVEYKTKLSWLIGPSVVYDEK